MELKELQKADFKKWDDFVDKSPQGSIFSKTWYVQAIGLNFKILVVERENEICAGIVLGNNNGAFTFGPLQKYTGVLYAAFEGNSYAVVSSQRTATNLLLQELKKLSGFDYFFHPAFTDWLPFFQQGYKQSTYYTYRIALNGLNDESLLQLSAPRMRTKIRKAIKDDRISIKPDIKPDDFYSINRKTFERQGQKPPYSRQLFLSICAAAARHNALSLFGVQQANGTLSSVVGLVSDSNCAYLLFSGFDGKNKEDGEMELLIYHAIRSCLGRLSTFDFEGSMIGGIESFYRQFGGVQTPYFRIQKASVMGEFIPLVKKIVRGK